MFSGAGIIKGDTGHLIGALSQEDTECLSWLTNKGKSGAIKAYDRDNQPMTYEMKTLKSKIKAIVDGDDISFEVSISTEGLLRQKPGTIKVILLQLNIRKKLAAYFRRSWRK